MKSGIYGAGVTKIHIFDHNNWSNYYEPFIQAYPEGEHVYGPVLKGGRDNPVGIRMASERMAENLHIEGFQEYRRVPEAY